MPFSLAIDLIGLLVCYYLMWTELRSNALCAHCGQRDDTLIHSYKQLEIYIFLCCMWYVALLGLRSTTQAKRHYFSYGILWLNREKMGKWVHAFYFIVLVIISRGLLGEVPLQISGINSTKRFPRKLGRTIRNILDQYLKPMRRFHFPRW